MKLQKTTNMSDSEFSFHDENLSETSLSSVEECEMSGSFSHVHAAISGLKVGKDFHKRGVGRGVGRPASSPGSSSSASGPAGPRHMAKMSTGTAKPTKDWRPTVTSPEPVTPARFPHPKDQTPRSRSAPRQPNANSQGLNGQLVTPSNPKRRRIGGTPSSSSCSRAVISDSDEEDNLEQPVTSTPISSRVVLKKNSTTQMLLNAVMKLDHKVSQLTDSNNKVLAMQEEILRKLSAMKPADTPRAGVKLDVPGFVRSAVKDGFKSGEKRGLSWSQQSATSNSYLKPHSEENEAMTEYIDSYVHGMYTSTDPGVRKAAIERYFKSFVQKMLRQNKGQGAAHNKKMVQYERKKRKRDRRVEAAKLKKSWPQEKKEQVISALKIDYMSSEYEHDSEGESMFEVRPLLWRSEEFVKTLMDLDSKALSQQSARSKRQQVKRVVGEPSSRPAPTNAAVEDAWVFCDSGDL